MYKKRVLIIYIFSNICISMVIKPKKIIQSTKTIQWIRGWEKWEGKAGYNIMVQSEQNGQEKKCNTMN